MHNPNIPPVNQRVRATTIDRLLRVGQWLTARLADDWLEWTCSRQRATIRTTTIKAADYRVPAATAARCTSRAIRPETDTGHELIERIIRSVGVIHHGACLRVLTAVDTRQWYRLIPNVACNFNNPSKLYISRPAPSLLVFTASRQSQSRQNTQATISTETDLFFRSRAVTTRYDEVCTRI